MRQLGAVTVIGRDKTGVVARVTAFLSEQRASLEAPEEPVNPRPVPHDASSFMVCKRLPCRRTACRVGQTGTATLHGNQIPVLPTEAPPAFRIMAIREPHDFEALMIAPYRREIKADPGARPGPSPRPRTTRPKIQTAVCPHPGNNTRCACSKRRRLISWYCTVHGNSPAQPREAVQKHDHQPSPPPHGC